MPLHDPRIHGSELASGQDRRGWTAGIDLVATRLGHVRRAAESLIEAQRAIGLRVAARDREIGELPEVLQAGISPPAGLVVLNLEVLGNLGEALSIDAIRYRRPGLTHAPHLIDTQAVAMHQLFPQRATRAQSVLPAHLVEEQQQ